MYAIVRKNTYDLGKLAGGQEQLREFNRRHAQQPGFRGSLSVDIGDGQSIIINLWGDRESAEAALPAMIPIVKQFVEPLLAAPPELLGSGPVTLTDLNVYSVVGSDRVACVERAAAASPKGAATPTRPELTRGTCS